MSANTSIKEGGKGRAFGPVTALMVQGDDGKYLPWVPESERQLDTLSVSKNGVYQAKKDGVYGWRSVSVNVPTDQGVTGKDPTTGQQVAVGVDPITGELTETVVPVEIRVETPPTFTGPYGDRAYISFDGLTVAAYGEDGNKMQDVPFNELVFPVTVTDYSAIEGYSTASSELIDGSVGFGSPPVIIGGPTEVRNYLSDGSAAFVLDTGYFVCSATQFTSTAWDEWGEDPTHHNERTLASRPFTYNGKTVYVSGLLTGVTKECNLPINTGISSEDYAAWTIIYGDVTAGGQPIPVQWPRKGDGAVLETSFYVEVVDVSPSNNDGN